MAEVIRIKGGTDNCYVVASGRTVCYGHGKPTENGKF